MPYVIRKQGDQYCLYKEGDGESLGCHETRQQAEEQRRALYASEASKSTAIKLLDGDRVGGYGVVWGGADQKDLEGDYFTPETNFWLDTYQNQPALFDHTLAPLPGLDDLPENVQWGTVKRIAPDDIGLWVEAQLDAHDEWVAAVRELIAKGVLHWSSGSVSHMVRRASDGWLKSWPIVEMSATPTPAEPRRTGITQLKHLIQGTDQDGDQPQGGAFEAAPAPDGDPVSHSFVTQEDQAMTLTLNDATWKAVVRAYVENNQESIADAVKAVKQDGGENMITMSLRPLAEQLAEMAGSGVEETLAYLVEFVAQAAAGAPEPEPEPMEEELMSADTPAMLSISRDELNAMLEQAAAKAVQSQGGNTGAFLTKKNVNINLNREEDKPWTLGRHIKAVRDKRYDLLEPRQKTIKAGYKALGISPDTAGGYLVPIEQSNQTIELLRARATVLPLCRIMPMNSATLTIPTQTGGATAYWGAENAQLTESEETFGQKLLVAKKLTALVKVSNELLEDSDPAVDALIREDIATVMALAADAAILRGAGVGDVPLGILYSGATATALNAALTYAALSACVSRVEVEDVIEQPNWAWVFHPRERNTLRQLEDTSGQLIWRDSMSNQQALAAGSPNTVLGYPVHTTSTVAKAGSPEETRAYFGQWNDVIVGQRKALEIMASNEAGTSFEYDQTWIRAIMRMDVVLRHTESMEVLTDVRDS